MSQWYTPLEYVNIAQAYLAAPLLWDSLIYLLIFLGLTTFVFTAKKNFGKKRGKPVAIGFALALTIAMVVWEYQTGWRIGSMQMAIIPLLIIAILMFFLFYKLLHDMLGVKPAWCALAISYLIIYMGMSGVFRDAVMDSAASYPLVHMLLTLMTMVAVFSFIACIIKLFTGGGDRDSSGGPTWMDPRDDDPNPNPTPRPGTLRIRITPPGNRRIAAGSDERVLAQVTGNETYVWRAYVDGAVESQGDQRRAPEITITNAVDGHVYEVRFEVTDGTNTDQDSIRIVVGEEGPETGRISGLVIQEVDGNREPVHRAIVQMMVQNGPGAGRPINEPWARARTNRRGEYAIRDIPLDPARMVRMIAMLDTPEGQRMGVQVRPPNPLAVDADQPVHEDVYIMMQQLQQDPEVAIRLPEAPPRQYPVGPIDLEAVVRSGQAPYRVQSQVQNQRGNIVFNHEADVADDPGEYQTQIIDNDGNPLPPGGYALLVVVQDANGRQGRDQRQFIVEQPPDELELNIHSPGDGQVFDPSTRVPWNFTLEHGQPEFEARARLTYPDGRIQVLVDEHNTNRRRFQNYTPQLDEPGIYILRVEASDQVPTNKNEEVQFQIRARDDDDDDDDDDDNGGGGGGHGGDVHINIPINIQDLVHDVHAISENENLNEQQQEALQTTEQLLEANQLQEQRITILQELLADLVAAIQGSQEGAGGGGAVGDITNNNAGNAKIGDVINQINVTVNGGEEVDPDPPEPREPEPPTGILVIPLGPRGHDHLPVRRSSNDGSGGIKYVSYTDRLTNTTPVQFNVSKQGGRGSWYQQLVVAVRMRAADETPRWLSLNELRQYGIYLSMLNTRRNPEEVLALNEARGRIQTNVFRLTTASKTFQIGFGREEDQASFFERVGMGQGSMLRFYVYSVLCDRDGNPIPGHEVSDGAFVEIDYV